MSRRRIPGKIDNEVKQIQSEETKQIIPSPATSLSEAEVDAIKLRNRLSSIIPEYGQANTEKNKFKKIVDELNAVIKETFNRLNLNSFTTNGYVATLSDVSSTNFDPEILLALVKELGLIDMIVVTESVDLSKLETLLYDENVPKEVKAKFASAQVTTVTKKLSVKKIKEKKNKDGDE